MTTYLCSFGEDSGVFEDNRQQRSLDELFEYLSENPRHALLYHLEEDGVVLASFFVARNAGDETFFYGPHPVESPDDVWEDDCQINDGFDLEDIFIAIEENLG